MQNEEGVISGLESVPEDFPRSAVSIGIFDGVHLGHQSLLATLRSEAQRIGQPAVVLTFERHPMELLAPERAPLYINTLDQKLSMLRELADIIVVDRFERELSELTPEEFVDRVIIGRLHAAAVVVGTNFRFGKKRVGDINVLRQLGAERGLRIVGVEPIILHGATVSSTRIRNVILKGDVESASGLLGRPFTMQGTVVRGLGLGRKLGFPTANIEVAPRQVVPANGVYAVQICVNGEWLNGVCSIGTRPTLNMSARSIEIYIDGFEGNIYGAEVSTAFRIRLRDEIKFAGLDELKVQIAKDVEAAKRVMSDEQA